MMKNNKSIIEGHKVFYGDEYGDQRRIESIERIDSIRGKIENIINEIFNKNELIYEAIIKNLCERIKEEDYEQIYEDANKLINFLEEKKLIEFAQNFSIYNEDIKSIISIYMNVTQTRNNAYKKYIIEALNLNNTDYINILLDSFKNKVDILLKNIIKKIQGNSYLEALIINGNLNEAINEIYEKYFNSNLMN